MAKKKRGTKRAGKRPTKKTPGIGHSKRIDPADYGIDLAAIVRDEIKPRLADMTHAEVGEAAGMSGVVAGQILAGIRQPSLGAAAALAAVAEGHLEVRFAGRISP